jgi:hypothetical protein
MVGDMIITGDEKIQMPTMQEIRIQVGLSVRIVWSTSSP